MSVPTLCDLVNAAAAEIIACQPVPQPDRDMRRAARYYHALLAAECESAGVILRGAMSRTRRRDYSLVRWRVWRKLRDEGYSFPAIGVVAARHHTTIMSGLDALARFERAHAAQIAGELA